MQPIARFVNEGLPGVPRPISPKTHKVLDVLTTSAFLLAGAFMWSSNRRASAAAFLNAGLVLGMCGMLVLLGEDVRTLRHSPVGALFILGAALTWALGTVLLRRWKVPLPQNTLTGWMMLLGWIPIAVCVPFFDPHPLASLAQMSGTAWFAVLYNIFLAGTLAHWAWFKMARTLPVAVSSLSSLPVPVVGVLSGMLFLGERPGPSEFVALGLVLASLAAVLLTTRSKADVATTVPE